MIANLPQRVRQAAGVTVPLAAIEMCRHAGLFPWLGGPRLTAWLLLAALLTTFVVFKPGFPLLAKGWVSYTRGKLNMFSLIAPGILITYLYSVVALLAPGLFPDSFRMHGTVPVYFEAAAMITTLVLLGQLLEERAERHTGDALESLSGLLPDRARVVRDGKEISVAVEDLTAGMQIRLRPGDRVPVDGTVISGEASVDESMLTGEPMPHVKREDAKVTGGTLVQDGTLLVCVDKTGGETVLAGIITMVRNAQESRAPIQRIADRVTGRLVPAVMLIAVITFIVWWAVGPPPSLWYGMLHAVTVLMITCPCALGLATPLSVVTGMGRGAVSGILIKDAGHLERLAAARLVVLDKTGTLTTGKPAVQTVQALNECDPQRLVQLAASVEHFSQHPLARAVCAKAEEMKIPLLDVTEFSSSTGNGVSGVIETTRILIGKRAWLAEKGIAFDAGSDDPNLAGDATSTEVWVACDGQLLGCLRIADQLKPDAAASIAALKNMGIEVAMLTGDHEASARVFGEASGISRIQADVLPDGKADAVKKLSSDGSITVMVGDGINDAPALSTADVGIAMGTGTETARASGHIILVDERLTTLVEAVRLSRAVMRNIKQNLFFAFAYNVTMIPIAAGALYPLTGLVLTPMLASVAMSASSLTVISNALRLRRMPLGTDVESRG